MEIFSGWRALHCLHKMFGLFQEDARCVIEGDDSPVTIGMKRAAEGLPADAPEGLGGVDFEN